MEGVSISIWVRPTDLLTLLEGKPVEYFPSQEDSGDDLVCITVDTHKVTPTLYDEDVHQMRGTRKKLLVTFGR